MKYNVIFLICLIASITVFGQNETKNLMINVEEVQVTPPKFTGVFNSVEPLDGHNFSAIDNYLTKNFVCPTEAVESKKEGTEIIRFIVTPNGWLTNFKVVNSVSNEIDKEMIRVLNGTNGMWVSGQNNGKPAAMEYEVSMLFGDYSQDEIVNHFVRQAEKYFTMGSSTLIVEHKPKKALKYFNKSVQYTPKDKGALLLRGICNYEMGNTESARKDWNRIVSLGGIDYGVSNKELADMEGYNEMKYILAKNKE